MTWERFNKKMEKVLEIISVAFLVVVAAVLFFLFGSEETPTYPIVHENTLGLTMKDFLAKKEIPMGQLVQRPNASKVFKWVVETRKKQHLLPGDAIWKEGVPVEKYHRFTNHNPSS